MEGFYLGWCCYQVKTKLCEPKKLYIVLTFILILKVTFHIIKEDLGYR